MPTLDLAATGNCTVASLVERGGRCSWFCFPRLDGDPVFNALIGGDAPERGFSDVIMRDLVQSEQRYVRNTAVLETTMTDKHGAKLRIVDFAPRFKRYGRVFHPPQIVRRIEPVSGRPRITVRLRPTFDYGATVPQRTFGSNHIRFTGPQSALRVTTDMPITYLLEEAEFVLDRPANLFIGLDETLPEHPDDLAVHFLGETIYYWRDWTRYLAVPFDWQEQVIRSAITLKLCSFEDTGAIIAALTTSIPESPGSSRNWDYRYCWLRDAFFTVNALNRLGATKTMEQFIRFVIDTVLREDDSPLAPLFPMVPGTSLVEREAPALPGYRGMGPVRIGNAAVHQRQNDVYGSIILTAAQMFWDQRLPIEPDPSLYTHLKGIGVKALRAAFTPDSGPWEYRKRERVHTFSAAMCWAAVHRLEMIARKVGLEKEAVEWAQQAAGLRREIFAKFQTREGWISGALDAPIMDATVLLLPEIGLLPATDERMTRTIDVISKRLVRDGYLLRYDEADDFGNPETAFTVCSFWYVDALAAAGRKDEALEIFKRLLERCNHVGLLSEDIEAKTGVLWGNFPQTYSHVGLIKSAMRLSRSWEAGLWRAS